MPNEEKKTETILLVDDDPAVLQLCQQILHLGGYGVMAAGSGKQALELLQDNSATVNLALFDVMMPGMNGVELAQHIHSAHPDLPIVLMTGYGPKEIAQLVGDNHYRIIWKPFKTESLLRMVENAMGDMSPDA